MGSLKRLRRLFEMNLKKFMTIGMVSLVTLVGCGQSNEPASASASSTEIAAQSEVPSEEPTKAPAESEATPTPEVDTAQENKKATTEQIQNIASLIGKKAEEVDAVLGEPANVQNLEQTDILLVRYYKVDYLDEMAKVEAVFNDNEQVVNYISFFIPQANDIEATKENLFNTLTELYGESTIERYIDVQGRQNRNWSDENLTYELTYFENNIVLDIYPTDK